MERYSDAGTYTWTTGQSHHGLAKRSWYLWKGYENQIEQFIGIPFTAKFGGATGNFNAHHVAFPKTDWIKFANEFVEATGIEPAAVHYADRTL